MVSRRELSRFNACRAPRPGIGGGVCERYAVVLGGWWGRVTSGCPVASWNCVGKTSAPAARETPQVAHVSRITRSAGGTEGEVVFPHTSVRLSVRLHSLRLCHCRRVAAGFTRSTSVNAEVSRTNDASVNVTGMRREVVVREESGESRCRSCLTVNAMPADVLRVVYAGRKNVVW